LALNEVELAYQIRQKVFGEEHPDTKTAWRAMEGLKLKLAKK